jgi:hypothetical protein
MSKYLRALALLVAGLLVTSTALATGNLLPPGGMTSVPTAALPPGKVVAQTQQKGLVHGVNFVASEVVWKENKGGNLDFLLQLTLNKGSSKLSSMTTSSFGGFVTHVFQFQNGATVPGQTVLSKGTVSSPAASRSPTGIDNGAQVVFGYGKAGVAAKQTTYVEVIQTSAQAFNQQANLALANSGSSKGNVGLNDYFQPVFVPEPSTFALWGGLFAGAALSMVWRQRRARALALSQA